MFRGEPQESSLRPIKARSPSPRVGERELAAMRSANAGSSLSSSALAFRIPDEMKAAPQQPPSATRVTAAPADLLSIRAAAAEAGTTKSRLRTWVREGRVPAHGKAKQPWQGHGGRFEVRSGPCSNTFGH